MKLLKTKLDSKGFTLIELMIATAVLVITLGGSLYVLQSAQYMSQESRDRFYATNAARSTMEAVKTTALANVASISTTAYVPSGLRNGTIAITTNPANLAGATVATVTITVSWTGIKNMPRSLSFTTMRSAY